MFLLFIIIFISIIFFIYKNNNILIKSKIDEQFHSVQDLPMKEQASDLMAQIKKNIQLLITHLNKKYPNDVRIQRLLKLYIEDNIRETDIEDDGTSFSIDKGEEIHLCLRDKKSLKLHKINVVMFVCIHEIAHVMSKGYGHNKEHLDNFKFLLNHAIDIGIYHKINYRKKNTNYCGIVIDDTPL
jgi:hypothetical protein